LEDAVNGTGGLAMTCIYCGRWEPPDETGYDADEICSECVDKLQRALDRAAEQEDWETVERIERELG